MSQRLQAKYVIIGLGILGSSVLKKLLQEGERDIVVIEKEPSFGGATQHSFGMLRVFHDSDTLRELSLESYQEAVRSPESKLAEKRAFLSLRLDSERLRKQIAFLQGADYPIELLSPKKVQTLYGITAKSNEIGVLEPESLTFDPQRLLQTYHQETLPQVTVVRDEVSCLVEDEQGIGILCQNGTSLRAQKVIIAAGVGSLPLVANRGVRLAPKPIEYLSSEKTLGELPQFLNAQTHEFVSQRNGKSYYRFLNSDQSAITEFLAKLHLKSDTQNLKRVFDVSYETSNDASQESFGRIPGSKGIYFMGAWNGNAFKLSWRLSTLIVDCLLSKNILTASQKGNTHDNFKFL